MNKNLTVSIDNVSKAVSEILSKVGVNKQDSDIILDTILFANKRGVGTHGLGRLPLYVEKIKSEHFNPNNEIEIIKDISAIGILDAHNGFGQIAAYKATQMAIDKAKKFGVGVVGVRNGNNFGTAGYFGDLAAKEGFAALIFANAAPAIMPTGGNKVIFGTNPICFAFPGSKKYNPILLDMATTTAARGKIRLAAKNGEKIPFDWAVGPDGRPTDDPNIALEGALLPIAGYKGYGLSMFVDILAGLLTGSKYAGEVKNLSNMEEDSGNGHLFIVIDIDKFMSPDIKESRINNLYETVKLCGEPGKVFMPGEIEYNKLYNNADTIEISRKQFDEINNMISDLGCYNYLKAI